MARVLRRVLGRHVALPAMLLLEGCAPGATESRANDDDSGIDDATVFDAAPSDDGGAPSSPPGSFISDAGVSSGECLAGHYTGTLQGTYTSYLTVIGIPIPITANIDLTLNQEATGGELPSYVISDGTLTGYATLPGGLFAQLGSQMRCSIAGTLDCGLGMLVGGRLADCAYCFLGAAFDGGAFYDGGPCLGLEGHFSGPLSADYDNATHAFVDGVWSAREQPLLDAGLPEGGGIDDAGFYVGPGNYGGSGTWGVSYAADP